MIPIVLSGVPCSLFPSERGDAIEAFGAALAALPPEIRAGLVRHWDIKSQAEAYPVPRVVRLPADPFGGIRYFGISSPDGTSFSFLSTIEILPAAAARSVALSALAMAHLYTTSPHGLPEWSTVHALADEWGADCATVRRLQRDYDSGELR